MLGYELILSMIEYGSTVSQPAFITFIMLERCLPLVESDRLGVTQPCERIPQRKQNIHGLLIVLRTLLCGYDATLNGKPF